MINTPSSGSGARRDGYMMRRLAIDLGIPFITTVQGAEAAADAILAARGEAFPVKALQEYPRATAVPLKGAPKARAAKPPRGPSPPKKGTARGKASKKTSRRASR